MAITNLRGSLSVIRRRIHDEVLSCRLPDRCHGRVQGDPAFSYEADDLPADLGCENFIVGYVGTIDGILGPQTRRAIAAFQADHGLAVTSAVDRPTLATLGLS